MKPIPTTLALLPFDLRRMSERVRRYHERHLMRRMGELDAIAQRSAPAHAQPRPPPPPPPHPAHPPYGHGGALDDPG
jgi:hypothetical protein